VKLYASTDTNNEHELKADYFKVKYLKPPFPNHNPRFNEAFTDIAATRIMWVLGFPADHAYPLGSVACIGCGDDPFTNDLKGNTASLKDTPNVFKVVDAERELPWDTIKPDGDETWSWHDAAKFYSDGTWTHQQKVEYDAYPPGARVDLLPQRHSPAEPTVLRGVGTKGGRPSQGVHAAHDVRP
jgi:hypothetical protein